MKKERSRISYSIKVFKKNEQKTNDWSGGKTSEIAIFPEEADYQKLNFKWRISTATVEVDTSYFTILKGIWRLTMVMEGQMKLEQEGHDKVLLKPFEQINYSGEEETKSTGKVRNFNLMLAEGCKGELQALHLQKGTHHEQCQNKLYSNYSQVTESFYCINGKISMRINNNETIDLFSGDLLLLSGFSDRDFVEIEIYNGDNATVHVIRTSIYY
ncbi:HutD/Ves family protein [Metabacillus litoralis]|uniref:HutD/Ves family protein n=1 Tax=Metabacillus litoralis TaxID=152268 RepID=UPI00203AD214|nr:HutD family protein [Metabacillus litoralis]MCM3411838.1 HutD family protein [Metabacillus litoralis]